MNVLKWLDENLEKLTGMVVVSMIVLMLLIQVISRYLFKYSVAFAEEAALMLFVIFTYLGSSLAIKRRRHLRITILVNRLNAGMQKLSGILVNILFFAAVLIVTKGLWPIVGSLKKYKMITPIMKIPKYLIYGIIMFIMVLMLIRLAQDSVLLFREYREIKQGVPPPERTETMEDNTRGPEGDA
ncbi:MAG: TRAP transporter small permease [Treponema sp.]|jgi:TRAP-type C4-dicarboxylate transport system permease small subunit|nr:TRAP transporter small permease [Treponema sp.]